MVKYGYSRPSQTRDIAGRSLLSEIIAWTKITLQDQRWEMAGIS